MSAEPTAPLLQLAGVAEPQDAAEVVFTHWRKVMGKNARTAFDAKRRRAVEARLRDGYSVEDLKRAIDGCSVTPHNIGQNDRGERYDDLELICRDAAHVDRFKRNATDPPALKATGTHSKAPVRAESIQHSSETGHDPTF